jgi:hypothetical protein
VVDLRRGIDALRARSDVDSNRIAYVGHSSGAHWGVSDIAESFAWFEKLGWTKGWEGGSPPTFGGVCSGHCEIFLCQGGRGRSANPMTFGVDGDQAGDQGVSAACIISAHVQKGSAVAGER